ncbi:hypothetical protein, partial [Sutterella sp.]|uniref:hypothetical protein n=1 Tax=Sutterella sp. TaxID=1981025 RepID=UPI0026DEB390
KKTAWKLCGIYLIIHRSGAFYIARTTDMKDRLRFHRYQDAFADHQWIAFRPCPQKELRKLEALMIGCAARARLPILNRVAAQHGPYPMDLAYSFDEVFPPWAQERFLAEGELHGETVLEQFAAVYEGAILCERDAWKVFRTERHARGMLEIAHRCILMAIPNPWELENLWWAIQLPTGRGYPMLTLTAGGSKVVLKFTRRPGDPGPVMADLALARNVAGPETESGRRLREELSQYGVVWCDPPDGSADFRIGKDFCAALGWRYPDETARDKDMAREVTRALTAGDFVHLQAPLERAHLVLDHPDVQHAFKLAVMALLRRTAKRARVPHNPIATFSMRNGYCGLPPVPEMNTAAEQPDETASKSEDVKEEETAAA